MAGDPYAEAFACLQNGDLEAAAAIYRASLTQRDDPLMRMSLGQLLMLQGDFRRGLGLHESRPLPEHQWRRWRGQRLSGEMVLIRGEQGFGDNIQFVRYATAMAARGARVMVGCPTGLGRLLRTVPGVSEVVEPGQPLPAQPDYEVPLLSLPYLLGTTVDTIPAQIPYLRPDPELVSQWRQALAPHGGLKVGLVWGGNPEAPYDARRSPGLDPYWKLLDVPGVTFFSLQKGPAAAALATRALPANLVDLGPRLGDFDQTAAAMENLDLVISSCTSPAHLAGALGRPVWVVLASFPDWRWLLEREDSPWYPSARLFRALRGEDWSGVMGRVRAALGTLAGS